MMRECDSLYIADGGLLSLPELLMSLLVFRDSSFNTRVCILSKVVGSNLWYSFSSDVFTTQLSRSGIQNLLLFTAAEYGLCF